MEIVKTVLQQMSNVTKPQRKFMQVLLPLLMCLRGRANFRNLSRYSDYHEKTFSRWYRRDFDFVEFNRLSLLPLNQETETTLIAATDCSFTPKSGKHTEGLGMFYNGVRGDDESRVDAYLDHLKQDRHALPPQIRYLVADGYYSKKKYLDGVAALDLYQIGKLRHDANLRWLYQGEQKPCGRRRLYDGKVKFDDLSRFEATGEVKSTPLSSTVPTASVTCGSPIW